MFLVTAPFICRRCSTALLRRSSLPNARQSFTTLNPTPPPPSIAYAHLTNRRLVNVEGPDASHFLQGLITANVPRKKLKRGFYSAFLNAAGRVLYDVFIYPGLDRLGQLENFYIEVDASEVDALAKHLKRFKLRARTQVHVVDEGAMSVWALLGQDSDAPKMSQSVADCIDKRAPGMGVRHILHAGMKPQDAGEEIPAKSYDLWRILKGVAEGQGEIRKEVALPQESNIDYMGGIAFRKGCYIGQELTIRTHHTGVVRKRILPIQLYNEKADSKNEVIYDPLTEIRLPPRGAAISKVDHKGRNAGKFLGGIGNVGLALCRLETMTDTILTGVGFGWKPEDEFGIAWEAEEGREGGEIKVKACIPEWHKGRAEAQKLR